MYDVVWTLFASFVNIIQYRSTAKTIRWKLKLKVNYAVIIPSNFADDERWRRIAIIYLDSSSCVINNCLYKNAALRGYERASETDVQPGVSR